MNPIGLMPQHVFKDDVDIIREKDESINPKEYKLYKDFFLKMRKLLIATDENLGRKEKIKQSGIDF